MEVDACRVNLFTFEHHYKEQHAIILADNDVSFDSAEDNAANNSILISEGGVSEIDGQSQSIRRQSVS